jgi:hypothetical protein
MVDYAAVVRAAGADPDSKDEWLALLRQTHGDIEDAKASLIFIADEEGFDVEPDDVETVTDEPPTATFT